MPSRTVHIHQGCTYCQGSDGQIDETVFTCDLCGTIQENVYLCPTCDKPLDEGEY